MKLIFTIYTTILFIFLTPNFLFIFPKKILKFSIILIHTTIFAFIFYTTIIFIEFKKNIYENFCNICNNNNINCYNSLGQQCILNSNSNYAWDTPCNSKNVGATSYSGNINLQCVNIKSGNINGNIYNWIPVNL